MVKDDRDLLPTPHLIAHELRLGLQPGEMPLDRIAQKQLSVAERRVGHVRPARLRQGVVCTVCKQIAGVANATLDELDARWVPGVQSQGLRTRLWVFQVVGRCRTTRPGDLQQIPRVDCWIEVDERGRSSSSLSRIDTDRACLAKRLQ